MAKSNPLRIIVKLEGEGREEQERVQKLVATEFMRTDLETFYRYRLMVNYATGTGKTKAAIETAATYYNVFPGGKTFIGCHSTKSKKVTWPTELAQWGRIHPFTANVHAECYKSMHTIHGQHYSVVILDEAQYITENAYLFFEQNTYDAVIVLTATEPKDKDKQKIIQRLTYGRALVIKAEDAIKAKMINDYEVWVIRLQPDKVEKFKMFKTKNDLHTEYSGYIKMCQMLTSARKSGDGQRIQAAAINRKRYIGNSKTKRLAAKYIQNKFREKGERFLTMAAGIEQADQLSEYTFHSKSGDAAYNQFRHNQINELVSVNSIRAGENFENVARCLIIQPDKDSGTFLQIRGRTQRLEVGMISKIFILCLMGTQDEAYLREALAEVDQEKVKYMDLKQELYWTL